MTGRICLIVTAIVGGLCLPVEAQDSAGRGPTIAAQGLGDSVPACAQCHALNGIADGSGAYPRLTGQSAYYLGRQLSDYASGVRNSAIMAPIARALSSADRDAISAYFEAVEGPYLLSRKADPALIERGRQLARVGDQAKTLPACNNCHGPGGTGEFPAIPYLAGQYASYTALQLQLWKTASRDNSAESMAEIAKRLSDQDMAAVSAYYQQLREPASAGK